MLRRIGFTFVVLLSGAVTASVVLVLALRWIAPPVTMVMLLEPGPVSALDYRWVDRSAIDAFVARAVIASEDQKFLEHHGFDLTELGAAIESYRDGEDLRGASTITQQVAKNLFLSNGRSFARKAVEAYLAVLIELLWSKQRILEVYLNVAEFGPGVFGIEAASRQYFGTRASDLNMPQAALLAAVLPSPKRMNARSPGPYVRVRQAEILLQIGLLETRGHYRGLDW